MAKGPNTLTTDECSILLTAFLGDTELKLCSQKRMRNYAMVLFMLDAGLRVGEMLQLRVNDLYVEKIPVTTLAVRAEITKTKVERLIPCTRRILDTLETMIRHYRPWSSLNPDRFAFCKLNHAKPISARMVQMLVEHWSKAAIGRKITPHTLRHTFATRLMAKTNIRVVQKLLGHKSITSTQIYTHPNHEDLTGAIKAIE